MANKRVLEFAKELGVDVSDIRNAAMRCNIAASGPTSMLNGEDQKRIQQAISQGKHQKQAGGNKTIAVTRTSVGASQGGGKTVQVAVRRRRHPGAARQDTASSRSRNEANRAGKNDAVARDTAGQSAAQAKKEARPVAEQKKDSGSKSTASREDRSRRQGSDQRQRQSNQQSTAQPAARGGLTPAQRAMQSMEAKKQEEVEKRRAERAEYRQRQQARRAAQQQQRDHAPQREGRGADRAQRSAQTMQGQHDQRATRPAQGRQDQRRPAQNRQDQRRPAQGRQDQRQGAARGGPRTSMRTGLTPAQIAAAKAPKSSLKQIEKKISDERAERRREQQAARRGRNDQRSANAGANRPQGNMPRRAPSVAVSPEPFSPPSPDGAKKRGFGGPPPGGRGKRRLSPAEKAARRNYAQKRHAIFTDEQEERMARLARGDRRKTTITKEDEAFVIREVEITDPIMVSELASRMAVKVGDLIKKLFEMGMPMTANASLDGETAVLIVEEFGHKPKLINAAAVEDALIETVEENEDELQPRPPVVVVMGHVDHGKTSILDALRKSSVAAGEAGGITQHIGAYMVKLDTGDRVVFIDTPGHQAFTGLRARGAKLTDVAVLVVAADDGVMPQTIEAINHAKAADVPIIVAINKMDKAGADPERVMRQLAEHDLTPEEWGGDTICVKVSAHTGEGLDELLEMLALQTEILELRANPNRPGRGVIVESSIDRGRGRVATVLVQNGTFRKGDIVVVGSVMGRVRAIVDENNVQHKTAGPSIPFELLGLEDTPEAGSEIVVVENERKAREVVDYRKERDRVQGAQLQKRASMDELFAAVQSGVIEVPVVLKCDVTGTLEALADTMARIGNEEVKVKVVHKGIGGITESDVMLASASDAIIIGYNVRPETKAKKLADSEGVDIRFYRVIYDAIEEMKAALAGKLAPDQVEKAIGRAEVREVFQVPKVGAVAGTYVSDGFVSRHAQVRVLRQGVVIYEGKVASLRRFKDDVREVKTGYECGIGIDKFNDVKVGDCFEFFVIEEVAAKL